MGRDQQAGSGRAVAEPANGSPWSAATSRSPCPGTAGTCSGARSGRLPRPPASTSTARPPPAGHPAAPRRRRPPGVLRHPGGMARARGL